MLCSLCPRNCNIERTTNIGNGFCKSLLLPKIARVAPHYWEEPCISGQKGSGAIFFSGCTMRCVFCQNYEISALNKGKTISTFELVQFYKDLENQGVHNINLISAGHFIPAIVESLNIYKPDIPVVYNSGGYEKATSLKLLEGLVDIYLPDFKYSDNTLAQAYSSAPNYLQIATEAIDEMLRQVGTPVFDKEGIMQKGVIIRHLILPNHTKNSIGVLEHIQKRYGNKALVSLMGQYIPHGKAKEIEKLSRKITKREYAKVSNKLIELGLEGFLQELSSADKKYIPKWDFEN